MFYRYSASARSIVFRARDVSQSEGRALIEPGDILFALTELHPTLFDSLSDSSIDLNEVRDELAQQKTQLPSSAQAPKSRLTKESKQVLILATEQARSCWKQWEAPRRKRQGVVPEDVEYWEARLKKPLKNPGGLLLRRTWEVDERHLLLGLLERPESSGVAALTKQGVTLEVARRRLCATNCRSA
ncbi:MAG TPA: Clp protease N-terminal domain-containing protein [Silvibacterium sp.]|nr:Clp protease N-terminal domain-containing protein [Silvibacterium sp.]